MNHLAAFAVSAALGAAFIATSAARATAQSASTSPTEKAAVVEVLGGTATFEAGTNISAINVHGKSTDLRGRAEIRQAGDAIAIERLEATLPVKTLATGMGLRDEHMRKYVFTTDAGQVPDLTFVADKAECSAAAGGASACRLTGQLAIRGTSRPFVITLKVSKSGDAYRAAGDGAVMLSTYGIARPSQLGVTTADDVKLHLEFTARPAARQVAVGSGAPR